MKRWMLGALGLLVMTGTAGGQQVTDQQRRELEQRLRQLEQEMRDIQHKLGQEQLRYRMVMPPEAMAFTLTAGDRPRLGVILQTERNPATDSIGVVLQAVTPDGPADDAGLRAGDIIVRFNNERLAATSGDRAPGDRLLELARQAKEGDSVRVQYRRGKETKSAVIVPRKLSDFGYAYSFNLPDSTLTGSYRIALDRLREPLLKVQEGPLFGRAFTVGFGDRWVDMELTSVDADLGSYFGTTEGLLVVRAPKDSLLGLKSGDVILRIGGRVPTSPSHAVRILRSYEPGDEIRIEIMRQKRKTEVMATVPEGERGAFWEERREPGVQ
jgi:C-terminal processing protease CtpA/Prc